MRFLFVTLLAAVIASAGCTTSRAVRAWHAGIEAEDAGHLRRARRKYAESYGRNGKHVGAELARLRLLAQIAESRKKAKERLKELLEKKSMRPDVLLFAAWWAVVDGDLVSAQNRLDAVSNMSLVGQSPQLHREKLRLARAIAVETQRRSRTSDPAAMAHKRALKKAIAALETGQYELARDLIAGVVAADGAVHWTVRFNLAIAHMHLGAHTKARHQLQQAASLCDDTCPAVTRNLALLRR